MTLPTPVVLIAFNRPEMTARVLNAIAAVEPATMYVVLDGPRADVAGEDAICAAVREVIDRCITWPCSLQVLAAAENLGCRQRVVSGLDAVFAQCPEAIIVEDDCLPTPGFFSFCSAMLDSYRTDPEVLMVAGTLLPSHGPVPAGSHFFSRYFPIWGWATWDRAWRQYDRTMERWPQWPALRAQDRYWQEAMLRHFDHCFQQVAEEGLDTWDFQWQFTAQCLRGLAVLPAVNLVSNIGTSGHHTPAATALHHLPTGGLPADLQRRRPLQADRAYDRGLYPALFRIPLRHRLRARLGRVLRACGLRPGS